MAIVQIEESGLALSQRDYASSTETSVEEASQYMDGGQLFKQNREKDIAYLEKYMLPLFISGLVLFSLQIILIIVSVYIVSCVLKTQERRYKNVAHISWASQMTIILLSSVYSGFFISLGVIHSTDTCHLMDYSDYTESTSEITTLYNQELSPLLNTCIYNEPAEQNAAINMGIAEEAEELYVYYEASIQFLAATDALPPEEDTYAVYDAYIAQLDEWSIFLTDLTLLDEAEDRPITMQPEALLVDINERVNLSQDPYRKDHCMQFRDQVKEDIQECYELDEDRIFIIESVANEAEALEQTGYPVCYSINDRDRQFASWRYFEQGSITDEIDCTAARDRYNQWKEF